MDFMNLAEVPEVESVQDGDTVFVVRDGEVCRVAKDKVGGGAGGYVVNAAFSDVSVADGKLYILTPIPGMLDAVRNGSSVSVNMDFGVLFGGEEETGVLVTMLATGGFIDYIEVMKWAMGDDEDFDPSVFDGYEEMVVSSFYMNGDDVPVLFTNGQSIADEASVATLSLDGETTTPLASLMEKLRSKLGGGASDEL